MTASNRWTAGVLVFMVVAEVANVSEVATTYTSAPIFKGSVLLGLVTLAFALRDPAARARLNRWTVIGTGLIAVYLAGQVIAMTGSVDQSLSADTMWRSVVDLAFLLVILMLTQVTDRPWIVAEAIVATLTVLSLLTLVSVMSGGQQFFGFAQISTAEGELITTQRYGGPYGDSNFWGRLLVLGLPMAWALAHRSRRAGRTLRAAAWLAAGGALMIGAYLTQSRGTMLAAAVAVVVWFIASGRPARLAILPPALLISLVVPGIGDRLFALVDDLFRDQKSYSVDPSVLGREASQEVAWAMFQQRPTFGFGPGTFADLVPYYTDRVSTVVNEGLVAPHNLYAQLLAESGWIGLLTWIVMLGGVLAIVVSRIAVEPKSTDHALAAAVLTAIVTWSVASIFLHLAYFRSLAIVLALACALGPAARVPSAVTARLVRVTATWAMILVVGAAAGAASLTLMKTAAVQASQRVTLIPVGPRDGWASYAMNVRTREGFLPTFVEVMRSSEAPATITADPIRGIATFSVVAPDAAQATRGLANSMAVARTRVNDIIGPLQYTVQSVTAVDVENVSIRSKYAPVIAAGWAMGTMLLARLALVLWSRTRKKHEKSAPEAPSELVESAT
ncbi:O-antigen ligase family protein [Mycobacterium hodleri]|uniref:O-antigen ligase family protein n=1 Tax=Mycolicibacterium hodleri TaxID=49897 RepID=UPI0021F269D0|nr:O-antigen ligase family protein [Mycolicibacterium hodleri]MCV7132236.1 O-antigen ligase family protein [Mycolicibacterium hodleri]